MDERKQKLIDALKIERRNFEARGQDTLDHDLAIEYLIKNNTSENPDKFELLSACINDYETMLYDYVLQPVNK
jgi:hypothetical protein